jgi:hypothetical protein
MSKLTIVLCSLAVFAATGCGERSQEPVVDGSKRSYQGKRDTFPWDNEPGVAELRGGKWVKGQKASWEEQIKSRQLTQHEHKRIYQ